MPQGILKKQTNSVGRAVSVRCKLAYDVRQAARWGQHSLPFISSDSKDTSG